MVFCAVCRSTVKEPVCIPCGHIFCSKCLRRHSNATYERNGRDDSFCPACRASFKLVTPEIADLPKRVQSCITPGIRRVYLEDDGTATKLAESKAKVASLKTELTQAKNNEEKALGKALRAKNALNEFKEDQAWCDAELDRLDRRNTWLEAENRKLRNDSSRARDRASLDKAMLELASQMGDLTRTNTKLTSDNSRLREERRRLTSEVTGYKKELGAAYKKQRNLDQLVAASNIKSATSAHEISELRAQIQKLEQKNESLQHAARKAEHVQGLHVDLAKVLMKDVYYNDGSRLGKEARKSVARQYVDATHKRQSTRPHPEKQTGEKHNTNRRHSTYVSQTKFPIQEIYGFYENWSVSNSPSLSSISNESSLSSSSGW